MRKQKDTEANILWTIDMHYVLLKYSGTYWMTLIRMPLWRQGFHAFSAYASFQVPVLFQNFSWSQLRFCTGLPANSPNEVP